MREVFAMKLRIRFGKEGVVKFIGHLDIMRYFQKAFRRAGFDMKYSNGFHPHQIISFASPLGVGLESSGEYMDIEVLSITDLDEMKTAINEQMAEGITVYSINPLPDDAKNSMSLVAAADYLVKIIASDDNKYKDISFIRSLTEGFMAKDHIPVMKKTKKSEKEVDIRALVHEMNVDDEGRIFMKVSAGSAANIKPELILHTMGIPDDITFSVKRLDMYADVEGKLISLEEL